MSGPKPLPDDQAKLFCYLLQPNARLLKINLAIRSYQCRLSVINLLVPKPPMRCPYYTAITTYGRGPLLIPILHGARWGHVKIILYVYNCRYVGTSAGPSGLPRRWESAGSGPSSSTPSARLPPATASHRVSHRLTAPVPSYNAPRPRPISPSAGRLLAKRRTEDDDKLDGRLPPPPPGEAIAAIHCMGGNASVGFSRQRASFPDKSKLEKRLSPKIAAAHPRTNTHTHPRADPIGGAADGHSYIYEALTSFPQEKKKASWSLHFLDSYSYIASFFSALASLSCLCYGLV